MSGRHYETVGHAAAHMTMSEQDPRPYGLGISVIVTADEAWSRQVSPRSSSTDIIRS